MSPASLRRGASWWWGRPEHGHGPRAIIGGRPTAAHRPRFDAVGRWLLAQAEALRTAAGGGPVEAEATVFTNVTRAAPMSVRPWVDALRNVGYAVFAKPKLAEDSDVDDDMLDHIEVRRHTTGLAGLIVASADGQSVSRAAAGDRRRGTAVTVIGIPRTRELERRASTACASSTSGHPERVSRAAAAHHLTRCPTTA